MSLPARSCQLLLTAQSASPRKWPSIAARDISTISEAIDSFSLPACLAALSLSTIDWPPPRAVCVFVQAIGY